MAVNSLVCHKASRLPSMRPSTVIDLLGQGLGAQGARSNGLGRLAGSWSEDEFHDFERATAPFEGVDEELWH